MLAYVLGSGCTSPPRSDWAEVAAVAVALRPGIPAGDGAILDGLEARARDSLSGLHHPDTAAEWEKQIPKIRMELRKSLGLEHLPPPVPRNVRSAGTLIREGYRLEKLVYETFPQTEVPAHLYLPAHPEGKVPGVLFVPGHWYADSKSRPDFQSFAISMALRGIAVLSYDPVGQGERGISIRDHRRTELLAVGVAQEAVIVFESLCALEVLLARPEIDRARVGMTGASGGGFNSWMVPALEPRIAVTVPVVGTSDFLEQLRAVRAVDWFGAKEHCHFIPRLYRYANNQELLACVAPRPVLVISAHHDLAFPIPGQREVVQYGRSLYEALKAPGRVGYFEDEEEGHGYQKRKREAACGWFLKWLGGVGDGSPAPEPEIRPEPWNSAELRCFPPGENRSAGAGLVSLAKSIAVRIRESESGARDLQKSLSSRLGLRYPLPLPAVPDLVWDEPRLTIGDVREPRNDRCVRVGWRTPDGVLIPAILLKAHPRATGALVVLSDRGKESALELPAVEEAYAAGVAVLLADVRGTGELALRKPGWIYAVSQMLGENLVGQQALDLIAGVRALEGEPWLSGKRVGVLATGPFAALAGLYAAILEPAISWVAAEEGFSSFRDFVLRPGSEQYSFALAAEGKEREVVLDREIPHALVAFGAVEGPDITDLLRALGKERVVWASARDGDFQPVPSPASALEFVRARLEEFR